MNIGVTAWEDRVSPVFDSAKILLIARVEGEQIVRRSYQPVDMRFVEKAVMTMHENDVKTIICGAVSEESITILESNGIRLFPFITGEIETILERFIRGEEIEHFVMPGCWCHCPKCPKLREE